MKNFLLSLLICAFFLPATAQLNVWGPAAPFSDSLTDNTDATLNELNYYAGVDHYVFWVRSTDASSSDIVARRYYTAEEPEVVLSDGIHHYRNPQLIPIDNWNVPDTLFALFYEADLDGDFDIYYQFYTPLGFTAAYALTENDQDDTGMEVNDAGGIIWENSGTIWFTSLLGIYYGNQIEFDTVMLVDDGVCSHPVLSHDGNYGYTSCLSWEKTIAGQTGIMMKKYDWNGNWYVNEVVSIGENNTHPRFSEGTFSEVPPTLSWNMTIDDSLVIYASDLEDMYFISDFKQTAPFNPHCYNIFIGVDWLWDYSIITFENEEGADIFGGEWGWYSYLTEYKNISNSPAIDRNPYLWEGQFFGDWEDVINIWESYRNGHWQLWTAMIPVQIWGGVEEQGKAGAFDLKALPNPFIQEVKLSFDLNETALCSVSLMNLEGKSLLKTDLGKQSSGHHEVSLSLPGSLPAGIYIAVLEAEGVRQGVRIVKR